MICGFLQTMEIYKDVIGYEGLYQVSNLGNVKSLKLGIERNINLSLNCGYLKVNLRINGIQKRRTVHQLVAESFLNHKRCGFELVINHIDFDKTNNRLENLEVVTQRANTNQKHIKSSSKYVGVYWCKTTNKWKSQIRSDGKVKHLGYFIDELESSEAYQKELLKLTKLK